MSLRVRWKTNLDLNSIGTKGHKPLKWSQSIFGKTVPAGKNLRAGIRLHVLLGKHRMKTLELEELLTTA